MMRRTKKGSYREGFSLPEVMIASIIVVVAVLGTMSLRYTTAVSARKADLNLTAVRACQLLLESWRGSPSHLTFDPETLDQLFPNSPLVIEYSEIGAEEPDDFTLHDMYSVQVDDITYYATLSYNNLQDDLIALNVIISWEGHGQIEEEEEGSNNPVLNRFVALTTIKND